MTALSLTDDRLQSGGGSRLYYDRSEAQAVVENYTRYLKGAAELLQDKTLTDIYLNPGDSAIWVNGMHGKQRTHYRQRPEDAEQFISSVVSFFNVEFSTRFPYFERVLPFNGSRFTAFTAPFTPKGTGWVIRLPVGVVPTLQQYIDAGIIESKETAKKIRSLLVQRRNLLIGGEMGSGKALDIETPVLTPAGWRPIGSLNVGEEVMGRDGLPHRVLGVYPQGRKEAFRVAFSDGSSTIACDEHLWAVRRPMQKWRGKGYSVKTLAEIRSRLHDISGNALHFIPLVEPIQFAKRSLPLDPYLLGLILGDGTLSCKRSARYSSADAELLEAVMTLAPPGTTMVPIAGCDYRFRAEKPRFAGGGKNTWPRRVLAPLSEQLECLGLTGKRSWEKSIPESYLFADVETRLALLQGLLDTDGTISVKTIEYSTTSPHLAEQVAFLVQSLGGTARTSTRRPVYRHRGQRRQGRLSYRVFISLPNGVAPFRLERKRARVEERTKYEPTRAIISVEPVGDREMVCIMVDAPDHLFVVNDCIVTHNTTLLNALLAEIVALDKGKSRFALVEDCDELRCDADDYVKLNVDENITVGGVPMDWGFAIKRALRLSLNRIMVGEIRSHASVILDAWRTGHPGNLASIHGGDVHEVMGRFEFLLRREHFPIDRHEIAKTIHGVIVMKKVGAGRIVREVKKIDGVNADGSGYLFS
jgi:Flp pilus assembly CpaF family ATPase